MRHRRFLQISSLVLLLLISSGCSLIPKEVQVQTKFVEKQIPIQGHPKGLTMYPIQFYAVTEENFEEFKEKFEKENAEVIKHYQKLNKKYYDLLDKIDDENHLLGIRNYFATPQFYAQEAMLDNRSTS